MQSAFADMQRRRTPRGGRKGSRRYSRYAEQLLRFFAEHRTALASQVQRCLRQVLPTDRTTRLHLQTLVANGDLIATQEPALGQPNVYHVTAKGLRNASLEEADAVASTPRRRRPTGSHTLHELLITEVATSFAEIACQRTDLAVPWHERFGLAKNPTFAELVPDYAFLFTHPRGRLVCLTEMSSGEESPTRIGQKLRNYADWSASPEAQHFLLSLYRRHGAQDPRPQFRLVVVAQNRRTGNDETRLRQILKESSLLNRPMAARLWVTTVARLTASQSIDGAIWTCAEDAVKQAGDWDVLSVKERRQRLAGSLSVLPRRRFFPTAEG